MEGTRLPPLAPPGRTRSSGAGPALFLPLGVAFFDFDSARQRAALLILLLGVGIAIALAPYASGLIGAAVLYVLFAPLNGWLQRYLRPAIAAGVVTAAAVLVIVFPGASAATLLVNRAQSVASGFLQSPLLHKLDQITVGGFNVGPQLAAASQNVASWFGSLALGLLGTATRLALNLTIAFFGLYFLLLKPHETWELFRPYVPFSGAHTERLRKRFQDVTNSTLIGIMLVALVQGALTGLAFAAVGLSEPFFWGVVTAILSILPVVGSPLVWGPGVISLGLDARWGAAVGLAIWGTVVVSSADNFIRPLVYRRWAHIHPVVTLVGAFGGIRYFGLLGILIGPLGLSYFFELIRMYREEYIDSTPADVTT